MNTSKLRNLSWDFQDKWHMGKTFKVNDVQVDVTVDYNLANKYMIRIIPTIRNQVLSSDSTVAFRSSEVGTVSLLGKNLDALESKLSLSKDSLMLRVKN